MKSKKSGVSGKEKSDLTEVKGLIENLGNKLDSLQKEITLTQKIVRVEIVTNRYATEQRMDSVMAEFRHDNFKKLDGIVSELETIREDKELSIHHSKELKKRMDDLEKRITKLERVPV